MSGMRSASSWNLRNVWCEICHDCGRGLDHDPDLCSCSCDAVYHLSGYDVVAPSLCSWTLNGSLIAKTQI